MFPNSSRAAFLSLGALSPQCGAGLVLIHIQRCPVEPASALACIEAPFCVWPYWPKFSRPGPYRSARCSDLDCGWHLIVDQ
jgi:hypothetical protein